MIMEPEQKTAGEFASVKRGDFVRVGTRVRKVDRVTDCFFFCGGSKFNRWGKIPGTSIYAKPATEKEFLEQQENERIATEERWKLEIASRREKQPEQKRIISDIVNHFEHCEPDAMKIPLWRLRIAHVAIFGNPDDAIPAIESLTPVK